MSDLGTFSVSLAVTDIHRSKAFYGALGFGQIGGDIDQGWLIMSSGATIIGLFQGMFDANVMTFNPGGAPDETDPDFTDIRVIEKRLQDAGIELASRVETESGPGYFTLEDPDGNQILFDQHR